MDKTAGVIGKILSIILILLYSFLFVINAVGTTVIDKDYNIFREYAHYQIKYPVISLAICAGLLLLFFLIFKSGLFEKINPVAFKWGTATFIVIIGISWVFITKGRPLADQEQISVIATAFINNDFSAMDMGGYLNLYPHQLGIIRVVEMIYRVVGVGKFRVIMVINAFISAGIFLNLWGLANFATEDKRKLNYLSVFFVLFPVLPMHSFFVYGNLFGLYFATLGIRLFVIALSENAGFSTFRAVAGLGALLSFSMANICKNNMIIITIATILCGIIYSIAKRRYVVNILLCILMTFSFLSMKPIYAHYEHVSDKEILEGMPKTLWISMGLMEGIEEWGCGTNGWYNGYSVEIFEECEYDTAAADIVARRDISERIGEITSSPDVLISFLGEKIITQWSEPTYQAFWMVDAFDNHEELSSFETSLISGNTRHVISLWMRFLVTLVWFFNIIFAIRSYKDQDWRMLILAVSLLGGFVFHIIWEAKALYTLPYMILSIPTAVSGMTALGGLLTEYFVKVKK